MRGRRPATLTLGACCPIPHPPPQVGPSLAINYMAYETMRSVWLARTDRQTPTVRGVSAFGLPRSGWSWGEAACSKPASRLPAPASCTGARESNHPHPAAAPTRFNLPSSGCHEPRMRQRSGPGVFHSHLPAGFGAPAAAASRPRRQQRSSSSGRQRQRRGAGGNVPKRAQRRGAGAGLLPYCCRHVAVQVFMQATTASAASGEC